MSTAKLPNEIDVYVGSRIKLRRKLLGLSQEKLAEGLGLTFQQVQKYEKGTNRVGASRLQLLSNILKVEPGFFFAQSEDEPLRLDGVRGRHEADDITAFLSTREGLELNRAFIAIKDTRVRRHIIALARGIAESTSDTKSANDEISGEDHRPSA